MGLFDTLEPGSVANLPTPSSGGALSRARGRVGPRIKQEPELNGSPPTEPARDRPPDSFARRAEISSREPFRGDRRSARSRQRRSTAVPSSRPDKTWEVLDHIDGYADLLLRIGSGGAGDELVKEIAEEIKRMIGTLKSTPSTTLA